MGQSEARETSSLDRGSAVAEAPPDLFLKRFSRLLVLRYQASIYLDEEDVRLLDRCVYSTFCDCIELNAGETARQLLEDARAAVERRGPR